MAIPLIVAAGLSAAGNLINQGEANANTARMTDAMNAERDRTTKKNDKLGKKTRGIFDKVVGRHENYANRHETATANRTGGLMSSVMQDTPVIPTSGTSGAVQSALAKRMKAALESGTNSAQRLGALGGYGDTWLDLGLRTNAGARNIGVFNNFAEGNTAILPHLQQIAQMKAYKPSSGIGDILQGVGSGLSGGAPGG